MVQTRLKYPWLHVCNMTLKERKAESNTGKMANALHKARVVGFNGDGEVCAWFGGYGFNVYDAAGNWGETGHFTSGHLAGLSDKMSDEAYEIAKERMRNEGFKVVE